jgi:hypothetical protein
VVVVEMALCVGVEMLGVGTVRLVTSQIHNLGLEPVSLSVFYARLL